MPLYLIAILTGGLFIAAYFTYGRFLSRTFKLSAKTETPAHKMNDGVDFIPTPKGFLLGQHFSAIAAAGPIVGPILAGLWFGWLPVLLWIVGGAIFFGSVHDFSTLVSSVQHRACSIAEIVKDHIGKTGYLFFLLFVWFSLLYVITAFTDLTSQSFVDPELGGGVAMSSFLYLLIGLAMGLALYRWKIPLKTATAIFLPLVLISIWGGQYMPLRVPSFGSFSQQQSWNVILLGYCFIASVIPVRLLLQPRGYLGGMFLYGTLAAGVVGLFLGGETVAYPAFKGFTNPMGLPLFPLLFVTVACGACSGFHGIVASGTTSKQIANEKDCRMVGYGGMLLEGFVAIIALSTVMILAPGDPLITASPDRIYSEGLSRFVQHFGISRDFARAFTLLAFTTFIYDTLDVATRLARYILQELTGWKGKRGVMAATLLSLAIPFFCVSLKITDVSGKIVPAWKIFWTLFGTSNQLLAALTLLTLTLWLARSKKPWLVSAVPMVFMLVVTFGSLGLMIRPVFQRSFAWDPVAFVALLLLILAILLIIEAAKKIWTMQSLLNTKTQTPNSK